MKLVIVSGMSGSGRTVALHMLEDLGYYCIDNLPPNLLPKLIEDTLNGSGPGYELLAVGIDARAGQAELQQFGDWLPELHSLIPDTRLLFLQCSDSILVTRYSETRRKHPLSQGQLPLDEAIALERQRLDPLIEQADLTLDTSTTSIHQLREQIREKIAAESVDAITLSVNSFAFKRGTPTAADFVFDVRCLPNPYWEASLRELTGRDQGVTDWLSNHEIVNELYADIRDYLDRWLPRFAAVDRSYVTVAIGCTGGRHRSVYIAERLAKHFSETWPQVLLRHLSLDAAQSIA